MASSCKNDEGYSNLNLNDGDKSTAFSTVWGENTDVNKDYYIYIDLTDTYILDKVVLYSPENDADQLPLEFEISVSEDGENYTKVNDYARDAAGIYDETGFTAELGGVSARYVKLISKKLADGSRRGCYMAISEFEVFGQITVLDNMVLNRNDIVLNLSPDVTQTLEIERYRTANVKKPSLKYYSDDLNVATVNSEGLIVPHSAGETDVYVYDGTNLSKCHVKVEDGSATSFRTSAFYHSCWVELSKMQQVFDLFAEAGFDCIEGTRTYDMNGNSISRYSVFLCAERGMEYSVCDEKCGTALLTETDDEIIEIVKRYENTAGFGGIYLQDEPHEEYTEYAEVFKTITDYNPHVIPHLNLLPLYNFEGTEEYWTEFASIIGGTERAKYISFDYYPYKAGSNGFDVNFYDMLNRMRNIGIKYNISTGYYIQTADQTDVLRAADETEILYNASLGIAYGMKNYKYFVAVTPIGVKGENYASGILNSDFEPSEMYEGVKAANDYIHELGKILSNADAIEVYHTAVDVIGNEQVPEDFVFTPENKRHAIYTLYESLDDSGQQYVVITNKHYSAVNDTTYKTKVAEGIEELYLLQNGAWIPVDIPEDRVLEFTVEPGACCVVKLPSGHDASMAVPESDAELSENLALNKTVYVSSSRAKFWEKGEIAAYYLTDGEKSNGGWISDKDDNESFVIVDLGKIQEISEVILYSSLEFPVESVPKKYTITVSEDGKTFKSVAKVKKAEFAKNPSEGVASSFSSVSARFVKISFDTGESGGFGEIEIFG